MENNKRNVEVFRVCPVMSQNPAQHIVMIRPDILNGEYDLYFIQIAKAFQNFGHRITIITCSSDTVRYRKDLENINIIKTFTWIPLTIYGKFRYPLFLIKTLCVVLKFMFFQIEPQPSIVFSNASCLALPILAFRKWSTTIHLQNPMELMQVYHNDNYKFLNWMMVQSLLLPEDIIVSDSNSCQLFNDLFNSYGRYCSTVYPCVDLELAETINKFDIKEIVPNFPRKGFLFCCFGEYDSSSNFELALAAFCLAVNMVEQKYSRKMHLVLGGNYDPMDSHQKKYFSQIRCIVYLKMFSQNITMLRSLTHTQKKHLIFESTAILHPSLENTFSKTILEAMCLAKTVIATGCSFGREVLINQITGYLLPPNPIDFAEIMGKLINNKILPIYIGNLAETEFKYKYSFLQVSNCLNRLVSKHGEHYCSKYKCNIHMPKKMLLY